MRESYGFTPCFHFEGHDPWVASALLPLVEVKSAFTGRRGIAAPFSDYAPPLFSGATSAKLSDLIAPIVPFARRRRWRSIEVRTDQDAFADVRPRSWAVGHLLALSGRSDEDLLSTVRSNYRRKIRRAHSNGVSVSFHTSRVALYDFYRLHCMARGRLGIPPQPRSFFESLHRNVVAGGMGTVGLARRGSEVVAAQVLLHFNGRAVYKFGANNLDEGGHDASFLLMWHAMRHARDLACREFCFGRTDADHAGLLQFKDGWAGSRRQINTYSYDVERGRFVEDDQPSKRPRSNMLRILPTPILRAMGAALYRHFA